MAGAGPTLFGEEVNKDVANSDRRALPVSMNAHVSIGSAVYSNAHSECEALKVQKLQSFD
jgi:hypothetical protein